MKKFLVVPESGVANNIMPDFSAISYQHILDEHEKLNRQRTPLKVNTIICSICGSALNTKDKTTSPCIHLRELAQSWNDELKTSPSLVKLSETLSKFDILAAD